MMEEYAPVRALNRAYVYARVHGYSAGIEEAEKLRLSENHHYHGLLAELYSKSDMQKALFHCAEAIKLCKSAVARNLLQARLESLRFSANSNS
ncbi:hypothetical protein [Pedobacter yulinensis]|nr:hypothetical protein [Pedobacter yulinensis]